MIYIISVQFDKLFEQEVIQIVMTTKKDSNQPDEKDKLKAAKLKLGQMVFQAKKKILQGALIEAHEQLYKFITEEKEKLGGDDSVFLLPGLFAIAEIHIIEGRIKKAEEYLNAAHWSFLKNNDKNLSDKKGKDKTLVLTKQQQIDYKINLHRTFAKLYEAKNDYKQAINELKQSTYLQSTKWGPEHPYVAYNYFLMGKIFIDSEMQSVGQSFFSKVSEIWYRYLKNFFDKSSEQQQTFLIEQIALEEAVNYLTYIQKHFEQAYQQDQAVVVFTPVTRIYYSIGLLYKIFGDDVQCQSYLKEVYRRCTKYLTQDNVKTQKIKQVLINMNADLSDLDEKYQPQLNQSANDD